MLDELLDVLDELVEELLLGDPKQYLGADTNGH